MKQSIGTSFILNLVFTFLVILFAFLTATISYYKAYKVNTRILQAIEKFEGYNGNAQTQINGFLGSIGYNAGNSNNCKSTKGNGILIKGGELNNAPYEAHLEEEKYDYCVYYYDEANNNYSFGVITYIHINLPVINKVVKVPLFTKTEKIYRFTSE